MTRVVELYSYKGILRANHQYWSDVEERTHEAFAIVDDDFLGFTDILGTLEDLNNKKVRITIEVLEE